MSIRTIDTEDKLEYQFIPVTGSQLQFRVRASNDAHVALTPGPQEGEPMYEVFFGGWGNSKSVIRKNRTKPEVAEAQTPEILSNDETRGFWIRWNENTITAGKEGDNEPLLSYTDPEPIVVGYTGFCTGWGASGQWQLEARCLADYGGFETVRAPEPSAPSERTVPGSTGIWRESVAGMVPSDAVEGGRDLDGPLYVGRAHHEGALIPGKVNPQHSACYIAWGGVEHGKEQYEVLCALPSTWVPTSGDNIPPNAIPAGNTEDGEVLFVGRANHEGTVTIGKVQPSHKVLYIPFGGQEVPLPEYEVLVS
ncbi:C3 and PZP-like alpha-2-macroglobulin domain-containing protein 8 isoform X2 [Belonocnema kinseyi]|uniref:C3 and PZP-like alpha-2-macroglobulin domain-containing protein 8 isoform X2 n=1 Tax=Belonocnema kinseyi TaxID=2817044 RepID=UPI00143D76C2|nr:C3 and PZP-like alpha-2-macroglobulin domain-containing protein 8 isoform X2 [Belonocnema kinseyi]